MRFAHLLLILATVLTISQPAGALTLAKGGKAQCPIVLAADASEPEKTAARELSGTLKAVTGADFAIRREADVKPDAPQILVGPSARARSLLPDVNWAALGTEGIAIRTVGDHLVLAGGRPRGTLYAVFSFLEDTVGCRWWTGTESFIPRKPNLAVANLNTIYAPRLRYREAFYRDLLEHPVFAAKLKLNGHFYRIPPAYGNHFSIIGWCHTFYQWLPPGKYFNDHPDWYPEIGGKRVPSGQLCLSNPETVREMTRVVLEQIRKNPDAGIISVAQNDCAGRCECARCMALERQEGSPSGPLIRFVNQVAAGVEKEFPNVLVETLAYQYTRKPPRFIRPRHNVVVRLCSIECSFTQPLEDDANASFRDDIRKWSAIAPNLYIWDYVTNFADYILPHPNLRVLAPNLRFFEKNKAIGVFEQGDSATTVGDFVRLRAWLFAHLEWNPSLDDKKLIAEFMNGYYGPAGPHLLAYLNLVHDCCERAKARIGCYHHNTGYMTLQDLNKAMDLFAKAEAAVADNPVLSRRVRRERLPLDHAWLQRYQSLKEQAERENLPFAGPKDPLKACNEFIALVRQWDGRNYSEGQSFESYVPALKARFVPVPTPEELDKLPGSEKIVIQDGQFTVFNKPVWVDIVDDPKASDGKAARMPANHTQWAVQYHVTDELAASWKGDWACYIIARIDPIAQSGAAFQYGIWGGAAGHLYESIGHARDGQYRTYTVGSHRLQKGTYLWIAPVGDPNAVKAVYVDRVVLVKDKGDK